MHFFLYGTKYVSIRTDFLASVAQTIPGQWCLLSDNQKVDLFLFSSNELNDLFIRNSRRFSVN
jgi:hypothetical protein